jgi:hypothetical protein
LPPKYRTAGAGVVGAARSHPRNGVPSSATISSAAASAGRCAVDATGCGKKISRSWASHAAAGTPSTSAAMTSSHSMGFLSRCDAMGVISRLSASAARPNAGHCDGTG